MGEMNRIRNPYSAYNMNRRPRGKKYQTSDHKKAFRRISLIVKGGSIRAINKRLKFNRLPKLKRPKWSWKTGRFLPRAKIKMMWSPLPGNSDIPGNSPIYYYPGAKFIDIVGTSFFSNWPYWGKLNSFYNRFSRGKPFSLAEWGLNSDAPWFVDSLHRWCRNHSRCTSMVYYRGFDDGFDILNFPSSFYAMGNEQRRSIYPSAYPWQR
jgi:hypothetical protein